MEFNDIQINQYMNIKISIKDCDCVQTVSNNKLMSEVEHKKKTMLYAPPENDKQAKQPSRPPVQNNTDSNNKKGTVNMNSKQYRESERQMLNQLKKNGQNRVTPDMIQTSNNILQKQNQILQQNQRTLHSMVNKNKVSEEVQAESIKNQVKDALDQIKNEVTQIKKMRNQISNAAQQFNKNITQLKNGRPQRSQLPNQILNMNSDMRNMVQTSQNHLEGLENMEALKSLQNFNMEGYSQAINQLKKQIGQYLKQSQNIERQLKIRTAKLEKLEVPPKFQQQLYKPYQQHLNNRVKNIDLHAIRQRVYDKIGGFDYGKFQADVGNLMIEARNELGNFPIICKEHAILVPDIRIDQKELKNLDMKLPSVLDQYKAARGIKFEDPKKPKQSQPSQAGKTAGSGGLSRTNQLQQRLKKGNVSKKPTNLQRITTQPVDLAHQAKLTKQSDKRPTILQNEHKKEKRELQQRMQKSSKEKKRQDQSFQKYLENRAREELELLYKQKKQRLQKMQNELYQQVTNPTYIDLNLKKQDIQAKKQPIKKIEEKKKQQEPEQEYAQEQFENQSEGQKKKSVVVQQPKRNHHTDIREMGRDILKQKLKNLLGERNRSPQITHPNNFMSRPQQSSSMNGQRQIQNIATGFITMINNTLTQVNNNLAKSIERKIQHSYEKRPGSVQKKQPRKIVVPKLQSFRAPPTFNINLAQQPSMMPYIPMPIPSPQPVVQEPKKIVVENYDQYVLQDNNNYQNYEISSDEDDN